MDYGNKSLGLPSFALSPTSVLSFSDGIGKRLLTDRLVLSARQVVSLSLLFLTSPPLLTIYFNSNSKFSLYIANTFVRRIFCLEYSNVATSNCRKSYVGLDFGENFLNHKIPVVS